MNNALDQLSINTIRTLSIDAVQAANSGHPGTAMGMAPVALILSRQDMPVLDRSKFAPADGALKGAYVLADSTEIPDVILIATGTEVSLASDAYKDLQEQGIHTRVVSRPNWSLFERQSAGFVKGVLLNLVR